MLIKEAQWKKNRLIIEAQWLLRLTVEAQWLLRLIVEAQWLFRLIVEAQWKKNDPECGVWPLLVLSPGGQISMLLKYSLSKFNGII